MAGAGGGNLGEAGGEDTAVLRKWLSSLQVERDFFGPVGVFSSNSKGVGRRNHSF